MTCMVTSYPRLWSRTGAGSSFLSPPRHHWQGPELCKALRMSQGTHRRGTKRQQLETAVTQVLSTGWTFWMVRGLAEPYGLGRGYLKVMS